MQQSLTLLSYLEASRVADDETIDSTQGADYQRVDFPEELVRRPLSVLHGHVQLERLETPVNMEGATAEATVANPKRQITLRYLLYLYLKIQLYRGEG